MLSWLLSALIGWACYHVASVQGIPIDPSFLASSALVAASTYRPFLRTGPGNHKIASSATSTSAAAARIRRHLPSSQEAQQRSISPKRRPFLSPTRATYPSSSFSSSESKRPLDEHWTKVVSQYLRRHQHQHQQQDQELHRTRQLQLLDTSQTTPTFFSPASIFQAGYILGRLSAVALQQHGSPFAVTAAPPPQPSQESSPWSGFSGFNNNDDYDPGFNFQQRRELVDRFLGSCSQRKTPSYHEHLVRIVRYFIRAWHVRDRNSPVRWDAEHSLAEQLLTAADYFFSLDLENHFNVILLMDALRSHHSLYPDQDSILQARFKVV